MTRSWTSLTFLFGISWSVLACDSSAHSEAVATPPAVGESLAYESCSNTSHCGSDLRCIDLRCQSPQRVIVADFYAAAGRLALQEADPGKALLAYNQAVTEYERDNLSPPIDLLCEQGHALAQGREDPKLAEAAARVLHKCVLSAPANSLMSRQASDDLALLLGAGLDAELLARSETADIYMTGQAHGPKLDQVKLQVTSDATKSRRSLETLIGKLSSSSSKGAFLGCWKDYWKASKKDVLTVGLPLEYRLRWGEETSGDRAVIKVGKRAPSGDAALESASACVEKAASSIIQEASKGIRNDESWKSTISIRLGN